MFNVTGRRNGLGVRGMLAIAGVAAAVSMANPALAQDQAPPKRPARAPIPKPQPNPAPADPAAPPVAPATPTAPATTPAPAPAQPATTTPAPAQPKVAPKKDAPKLGPYVKQEQPRDLTLNVAVRVNLNNPNNKTYYRDPFDGRTVEMPNITPMKYTTLGFVFPIVPSTGSSDFYFKELKGELKVNDKQVDVTPEILEGYPGGVKLTRWDATAAASEEEANQVSLDLWEGMRCYNTVLDEEAAMTVKWPTSYPAEIATSLTPQLYVELGLDAAGHIRPYDDQVLNDTIKRWLAEEKITDVKSVPPVKLAKILAGKVWATVQISGNGLSFMRTGELSGMLIEPPSETLKAKRGSEQDVTALMAAVYRKVGLPARTVIGYDVGGTDSKFLQKSSKNNRLRSWVEFALYDESKNTINWVPVDVARMRKATNRPPPIDRPWNYFGTNDELSMVTPFALQFHPPTDVVAYGSPGFWGWFVTPAPAKNADQAIRFVATTSSVRGGQERDPKDPEKNAPPTKNPPKKRTGY